MGRRRQEDHGGPRGQSPAYGRGRRRRILTGSNLLLALVGTMVVFCAAVVLVLNFRQLYYFDINFLHIKEEVGLDDWIIRKNYDILIDYNLITSRARELVLPSFPISETGRIHFEEVRRIFFAFQYAGAAGLVLFVLGFVRKLYDRDFGCLKLISVLSVVIPLALGAAAILDWQQFFTRFHELLFRNDYWIFDPATDPVIRILPDEFFFHCAAAVLLLILLGSLISGFLYRLFAGRLRRR